MEIAEIKKQIHEIFVKEKIEHVYHIDDRINSIENKKQNIIAKLRQVEIQNDPGLSSFLSENGVEIDDDEDFLISEIEDRLTIDNVPFVKSLEEVLMIEPSEPSDIDNDAFEIQQFFNTGQFTALEPTNAIDDITKKISRLKNESKILVLFDLDLSGAGGEFLHTTGVELLIRLKDVDKNQRCICSIFTHLAKDTTDEIDRRRKIIDENSNKLNSENLFVLSKSRKNDSLKFGDGIKKVVLNPYYENIKKLSLDIFESAFRESSNEFLSIDTYEFDHMISHASNVEGVWAGETLLRIFNVIFDKNIKTGFKDKNYGETVNPFFERAIKLAKHNFPIEKEDIPEFNRNRIRNLELYVDGSILNSLYEPINNGDIFEIKHSEAIHTYILVAQECDVILRSNGKRNRKNDFFTLLRIDFKNSEQISSEIEDFTKKYGLKNHYFSNKFLLNNYSNDNSELIGVVDFRNELVVYASILDLVSFNNDGTTCFDSKLQYPTNAFCQALRNRFKTIGILCNQRLEYLNSVSKTLEEQGVKDSSTIIPKLIETISPTNKTIGNLTPYNDSTFDFGITRVKRLKTVSANRLLEKYGYYLSRPAELPDYADEIDVKLVK